MDQSYEVLPLTSREIYLTAFCTLQSGTSWSLQLVSEGRLKLNQQKVKVDVLESENATTTPSVSRPGYYGPFQERGG